MQTDYYEQALDDFLERLEDKIHDDALELLYTLAKAAFMAGWKARGKGPVAEIIPLRIEREPETQE